MTSSPETQGVSRPVTPVGILAAKLDRIRALLAGTPGLDPAALAELHEACELAGGLDPYLDECTTPESAALRALARRTQAEDWGRREDDQVFLEQEMLSGHVEGQLLKMLVHLCRARRVLEIGMFTGYSALAMAEALPVDGRVIACEIDAEVAAFACKSFAESPHGHKIEVLVAPALHTLSELAVADAVFELIFIDADKAGYLDYLDAILDLGLLAPHGVICVDNTLMQGQPYISGESSANGVSIGAFNQSLADDPRVEQVLVPLRDGLTLIRQVPVDWTGQVHA